MSRGNVGKEAKYAQSIDPAELISFLREKTRLALEKQAELAKIQAARELIKQKDKDEKTILKWIKQIKYDLYFAAQKGKTETTIPGLPGEMIAARVAGAFTAFPVTVSKQEMNELYWDITIKWGEA